MTYVKYVLKHPLRQDGHVRLNMDQQLPYFYTDIFLTLPNRRTFVVAGRESYVNKGFWSELFFSGVIKKLNFHKKKKIE